MGREGLTHKRLISSIENRADIAVNRNHVNKLEIPYIDYLIKNKAWVIVRKCLNDNVCTPFKNYFTLNKHSAGTDCFLYYLRPDSNLWNAYFSILVLGCLMNWLRGNKGNLCVIVWQSDRGKTTWPNSYWQQRTEEDNYWYCCSSWCKNRGKRKRKSGKVSGFETRDQKIVEIEKCRKCPFSGRGPWKGFSRNL